jgi:hypothetical protein
VTKLAASTTVLLCAIVAISLTVPSLAASVPSPTPQPLQDSVTGSGASRFCGGTFEISAQSGPSGENPTGRVTCGSFFGGTVTCLNVSGNVALLTIGDGPFSPLAMRIVDNGASGDRAGAFPGPPSCQSPLLSYADIDVAGDLVVVDAPPLPTSKDQCKNGGWRGFGDTFKNQGECVAFVERGPKPKP